MRSEARWGCLASSHALQDGPPPRGPKPYPNRSCLAPGPEVAREAGKAELFDFWRLTEPARWKAAREAAAGDKPACMGEQAATPGNNRAEAGVASQGTRASGTLNKVKVQFGTVLYYQFKSHLCLLEGLPPL